MMEITKEIIAVLSAAVGVLATGIPLITGYVHKAKKLVKERNWCKVAEILPGLITEAEKFSNYSGEEKKSYVKSKLALYSVQNKIPFDETKFDVAIEDIVTLTKEVNKREKDKISACAPTEKVTRNVLPLS